MDLGLRFIGIMFATGMAWLGFWTYLFPDRFLKKLYEDLKFWEEPPLVFARVAGLLCFIIGTYGGVLGFIPETFKDAHELGVVAADVAFTMVFAVLLLSHYKQKQ